MPGGSEAPNLQPAKQKMSESTSAAILERALRLVFPGCQRFLNGNHSGNPNRDARFVYVKSRTLGWISTYGIGCS